MKTNAMAKQQGKKKKISLFMTTLAGGGAERVMLTVAEALADGGDQVDLVVTRACGPLRDEVPDNVRLVDLGCRRIVTSVLPLAGYLKKEKPDAMLSALAPTNCIAILARRIARTSLRLVVSEHNNLSQATKGGGRRDRFVMPVLMRLCYPLADEVVAVSSGVADDLSMAIGVPRERISVIYNPVVTEKMLVKSREPLSHPWFAEGEPPVILAVGRLTAQKDFDVLIRAFAALRKSVSARLVILGEGELRSELEALVKSLGLELDVSMPGFVGNPFQFMHHAAVFVLSSRWEGFGNVLVEAIACGATVVSTDCPSGPAEILQWGRFGRLVNVGSPKELADAIQQALLENKTKNDSGEFPVDLYRPEYISQKYRDLLAG